MTTSTEATITGNLTRDPELRFTQSGVAVTNLGIAVNRRFPKKGTDEWQEETSFFDVVVWQDQAENVASSVSKGDRVIVSGRLQQRSWTDDSDGKHSKVELVADEVAVSMRWATVEGITKTNTGSKPTASVGASTEYDSNEEPF